jgi:2-dehydropantoate 2-reductase
VPDSGWPAVAVVGAGAVGCYFGGMLARAGVPVTLIGRARHVEAIAREGLLLDGLRVHERIPVAATTELVAARESRVVLFCVKTVDTEAGAQALRPHLAAGSVVVSLQNGVDNVERIYAAAQIRALPAVVYVGCAMTGPGQVKHTGRGDLILGDPMANAEAIARMFEHAGVPCRVSQTIEADLWAKMVMNCAYNAISALARARYGRIVRTSWARDLMQRAVEETVAVARAAGVPLEEAAMVEAAFQLGEAMAGARSSTAQDIGRGRPTEIDSLNGYVVRRGEALGVPTPVNRALWALVKLLEESAREERDAAGSSG